ncbi:MAG: CHASE2 domain-containing protein, partial [Campylobacterales bacterium]|nr:CHASE2 domain-containing protein [Campylobacterales bacterium]
KVEDVAFDTLNKFYIYYQPSDTHSPNVLLFAFDDYYMVEHKLFDEDNISNYGYTLPRGHIAQFITMLDEELSSEDYQGVAPKALFIDYDMSFSTMPYGKKLSQEDTKLLDVLKSPRNYTILLPKTQKANFIESSSDSDIQKAIAQGNIIFVSVALLKSQDGSVRRYRASQSFGIKHPTKAYASVNVLLWQMLRESDEHNFSVDNIVGNRIYFKGYDQSYIDEGCGISQSRWKTLRKYSAHCSIFENIEPVELNNSVILLGGTHSQNYDTFSILDVGGKETLSGIEVHANALMTMLLLNRSLQRVPLLWSLLIVFVTFTLLYLISAMILHRFRIKDETMGFILSIVLSSVVFFSISLFFVHYYQMWFNWLVPWVVFQLFKLFRFFAAKSGDANAKMAKIISLIQLLRR